MKKFEIDPEENKIQSINRTIRVKAELYDKLMILSEQTGASFNKIVNQCIAYALENMVEQK